MSTTFRTLDVDRLDPDSVVNNYPEVEPSGITLADAQAIASQVKSLVQSGQVADALALSVDHPPYGSDEAAKDAALAAVLSVLTAVRTSDIPPAVKALDATQRTVLVKYLYKAMGTPQGQSSGAILLNWLEKTIELSGTAPITKHINDRRTV